MGRREKRQYPVTDGPKPRDPTEEELRVAREMAEIEAATLEVRAAWNRSLKARSS